MKFETLLNSMTIDQIVARCKADHAFCRAYIEYAITDHGTTGKMAHHGSISTYKYNNKNCMELMKIDGSICSACYVDGYRYRKSLMLKLQRNQAVFTQVELTPADIPYIGYLEFRFESFADLNNELQYKNYCMIAQCNPQTYFAIWYKTPWIIKKAIEKYNLKKPGNMTHVYSYLFTNAVEKETDTGKKFVDFIKFEKWIKKHYPFTDRVFIVFDDMDLLKGLDLKINCRKHCSGCQNSCYLNTGNVFYIFEYEKAAAKKAEKAGIEIYE